VFWLGDFNYRLNLPYEEVRQLLRSPENLSYLLANDQLNIQKDSRRIFVGLQEGDIMFDPTYKYTVGQNNYAMGEKVRVPSWTDRILFSGDNVDQLEYSRSEVLISDHRPIRAIFSIMCKIVNLDLKRVVQKEINAARLYMPEKSRDGEGLLVDFAESANVDNPFMSIDDPFMSGDEVRGMESVEGLQRPSGDGEMWWKSNVIEDEWIVRGSKGGNPFE
jgi:hypothetical protein